MKLFIYFLFIFGCKTYCVNGQDMSNPLIIQGSNFPKIFQLYYKLGDFQTMLKLTSKGSRELFHDSIILNKYQQMGFAYELKLRSVFRNNDTLILNSMATINATSTQIRMQVVIEMDTVRIVLPSNFLKQQIFLYH